MEDWREQLMAGQVIPACPLALHEDGSWSQQHQRAVVRYYLAAGAGGLAVGVHSTQFAIRDPKYGLFEPVLRLAAEVFDEAIQGGERRPNFIRIAGICGATTAALKEAHLALGLGYHAGLLSLTALSDAPEGELIEHCQAVAEVMPVIGFYLQPAVGGRVLSYDFWRELAELERLVAIKIAPFNRYFTLDVVRAVAGSGRSDLALYTGNDDNIIADLLTPYRFGDKTLHIVGGLLGQWGVWTRAAVELLDQIRAVRAQSSIDCEWLARNVELTDANAAVFDSGHDFAGCIPGINEVLRRQGLLPSNRCLDPDERLSPGQAMEIDRVSGAYPELTDDAFVAQHLDRWLQTS